jgi:hypothetical protein
MPVDAKVSSGSIAECLRSYNGGIGTDGSALDAVAGNLVEVAIDGIGTLRNPVVGGKWPDLDLVQERSLEPAASPNRIA